MTRFAQRPLAIALSCALGLLVLAPFAQAQDSSGINQMSLREQRAKRMAELGKAKQQDVQPAEAKVAKYPNATRPEPDAKASGKMVKNLQALQDLYEKQDMAGVIAKADEVAGMPAAGAYEKSFAYSLAGSAAADLDDQTKAADYFAKALAANGLDNDSHFNTMYNLAVIHYGNDKNAEALATIDRFLAETKSDKAEYQSFRAGVLANLDRNDEAAAIYKDLVAKNPTDKRLLMNAVATLQGAEKFDQANLLLEDAYKRGMLSEPRELRALYVGYMNAQRWTDAQKVIEDGVAKGVLQSGPDLARDYQILAQNAYVDDKITLAIDLYGRAAPMAADGEAYLNLAKVLEYSGKKAEAKAAAQKALDKGVKKPDEARNILSR
jgi:tetratricopeptide (TPR) repeat protein